MTNDEWQDWPATVDDPLGDGTTWYVVSWWNEISQIEPGDFEWTMTIH